MNIGLNIAKLTTVFKKSQLVKAHLLKHSADPNIAKIYQKTLTHHESFKRPEFIWKPTVRLETAERMVDQQDLVLNAQTSTHGLGFLRTKSQKPSLAELRHRATTTIAQEEQQQYLQRACDRQIQGSWVKWKDLVTSDVTWKKLLRMSDDKLSFFLNATLDTLPSPTNLHLWFPEKSDKCFLCHNKRGNIAHILNNCPLCLDRYTWRHDSVLPCLKLAIEDHLRRKQFACQTHCTNCLRHTSCPKQSSSLLTQIPFVKSSENTSTSSQSSPPFSSLLPSNSSSRSTSSSSSSSSYHSPSSFAPCSSSSSFSSPVSTVPISHSPLSPSTNKTNVNHRVPKSSKSKPKKCPLFDTLLDGAIDWKTCWDLNYINGLKRRNSFPVEIAACTQMPDGILWSLRLRRIVLVELTVPWEENMHDANLRKRIRYENLSKMLTDLSWDVHLFSIEVGSRGYVGTSTNILLSKLGISSVDRKALRSKISDISLHCSYVIWLNRACAIWHPRLPLRSLEELPKPM